MKNVKDINKCSDATAKNARNDKNILTAIWCLISCTILVWTFILGVKKSEFNAYFGVLIFLCMALVVIIVLYKIMRSMDRIHSIKEELASKEEELASKEEELASKEEELASKEKKLASKEKEKSL